MSMLDVHQEALQRISEAYHEFMLCYRASSKSIYGIVEGKDDPIFYKGIIEAIIPHDWNIELIVANGKAKVISAYESFDWNRFNKNRICFFVDKDFSHFLSGDDVEYENLYITDMYSIENSIVNFGTYNRILQEVLNIQLIKAVDKIKVNELFEASILMFSESLVPLMAQTILWRKEKIKACLDKFDLKSLFRFSEGNIYLKEECLPLIQRLNVFADAVGAPLSEIDEVASIEKVFRENGGLEKFIRGKYLLWFMTKYSLHVHEEIHKIVESYGKSPKIHVNFGAGNSIVFVAPRARCPESLRSFLGVTFVKFIEEKLVA